MCEVKYPDMKLWQEIIFLKIYSICPYVIENVIPYYDVFITPSIEIERHYFWTNFPLKGFNLEKVKRDHLYMNGNTKLYGYDISMMQISGKQQILRNLVNPEIGLAILDQVRGIKRKSKLKQISILEEAA